MQDGLRQENDALRREVETLKHKIFELEEKRVQSQQENKQAIDSVNFHKALLAKEVVKLRQEIHGLKLERDARGSALGEAPRHDAGAYNHDENDTAENQIRNLRTALSHLETEKADVTKLLNSHKAILAKEVKNLRAEVSRIKAKNEALLDQLRQEKGEDAYRAFQAAAESMAFASGDMANKSTEEMLSTFEQKQRFELAFVKQLVDFRRKLSETALKVISGEVSLGVRELLSLSNQKIDTILQDIASVPAQDKLQQEALSLLKENANLRKSLNDYAEGLLTRTLTKLDDFEHGVPGGGVAAQQRVTSDRMCNPEKLFSW
jgi:hypothetical protein